MYVSVVLPRVACAFALLWVGVGLHPTTTAAQTNTQALPPGASCLAAPVSFARYANATQTQAIRLTQCDGRANLGALRALSILARPRRVPVPTEDARSPDPAFIARDIMRLDSGLLTRLQAIANHWPGETIVLVSGFRPRARSGSRHRHAQALDLQVTNVPLREVVLFARELSETGVGYYPNSLFTHIDVRQRSAFWVDLSHPGQPARYVAASEREAHLMPTGQPDTDTALQIANASPPATADTPALLTRSEALANALTQLEELQRTIVARDPAADRTAIAPSSAALPDRRVFTGEDTAPVPPSQMPSEQSMARMLARAEAFAEGVTP